MGNSSPLTSTESMGLKQRKLYMEEKGDNWMNLRKAAINKLTLLGKSPTPEGFLWRPPTSILLWRFRVAGAIWPLPFTSAFPVMVCCPGLVESKDSGRSVLPRLFPKLYLLTQLRWFQPWLLDWEGHTKVPLVGFSTRAIHYLEAASALCPPSLQSHTSSALTTVLQRFRGVSGI